jgi:hypothetical protein
MSLYCRLVETKMGAAVVGNVSDAKTRASCRLPALVCAALVLEQAYRILPPVFESSWQTKPSHHPSS